MRGSPDTEQGEEEIEDWELWGDPREIERRKAERARAAVPPDVRAQQAKAPSWLCRVFSAFAACLPVDLWAHAQGMHRNMADTAGVFMLLGQVAEEWANARAEGARAKAAADKARQKAAGQVIAGLKREIAQLGAPRPCGPPPATWAFLPSSPSWSIHATRPPTPAWGRGAIPPRRWRCCARCSKPPRSASPTSPAHGTT